MVFSNDPAEISIWRMDVASESDSSNVSSGNIFSNLNSVITRGPKPSTSGPNLNTWGGTSNSTSDSNGSNSDNYCVDVSGQNIIFSMDNLSGSAFNLNNSHMSSYQQTDSDSNVFLPVCKQCSTKMGFSVSCLGQCLELCGSN